MEDKSVFISSCSRRDLARRRPKRPVLPLQLLVVMLLVAAALGAFVVVHGGV
jgi:hypothetical protein